MRTEALFVGGVWAAPAGSGTIEVVDPATEQVLGTVPEGTPADVDAAVAAARGALPAWSATAAPERAKLLAALADAVAARGEELARTISAEVGSPITFARRVQAALPVTVLRPYAQLRGRLAFEARHAP